MDGAKLLSTLSTVSHTRVLSPQIKTVEERHLDEAQQNAIGFHPGPTAPRTGRNHQCLAGVDGEVCDANL